MRTLLRYLISPKSDYTFYKSKEFSIDESKKYGAYIHIPFCKNLCPYCPYYKIDYNKNKVKKFILSLKKEINLTILKYPQLSINSLYIGGGTPTILKDGLISIITYFKLKFNFNGEIAIEIHPNSINKRLLKNLKGIGVTHLSIGIQTFNKKLLYKIGRKNNFKKSLKALEYIHEVGFKLVNMDMMFALPSQTIMELEEDLKVIEKIKPDQVTFYPLFTFPYSKIGKFKKVKKVKMPNFFKRKKMYAHINREMLRLGYAQIDVWSFKRIIENKFSSVTRDYYIGFGPSAGTYTGKKFYFNTFCFEEYISLCDIRKPTILKLEVDNKMEKIFWLYWRFYETRIPIKEYKRIFNSELKEDFKNLLFLIRMFKFIDKENEEFIVLNFRGIFYIHIIQNLFALDYINKIWSNCQNYKSPKMIKL